MREPGEDQIEEHRAGQQHVDFGWLRGRVGHGDSTVSHDRSRRSERTAGAGQYVGRGVHRAGDAVHRAVTPSALDSRLPRMVRIGYAAALEQLPPLDALDAAVRAEQHGSTGVMASDM